MQRTVALYCNFQTLELRRTLIGTENVISLLVDNLLFDSSYFVAFLLDGPSSSLKSPSHALEVAG